MDTLSNMLTQIRNAQMAGKASIEVPFSRLKKSVIKILKEKGYIEDYLESGQKELPKIKIILKYNKTEQNKKTPAITEIRRVSKQSRRVYVKKNQIKKVKQGYGISIISTSKGIMTGEEAKKNGIGGEIICEVW